MKRIIIFSLLFLLLVPHTIMAEDIHQKIEITINPKEGNYTKMFNIVNANNSWLDNRHIWEGFRTDGRIVGEGIIPNPIQIDDFENDSGVAKMSIISVKYLDSYDVMSGTSDSYIRFPLAVNSSSYSQNITMRIKLYAIEGDNYNITSFNYTDVKYSTYATSYLLYSASANLTNLTDISTQAYTYPTNLTNLSVDIFYLHLRAPIIAKSTYILFQYIEIPDPQPNPLYVLGSYTNSTGYYYANNEMKTLPTNPSWSMLCKYGMSEDIYSFNIPDNKIYTYKESMSMSVSTGQELNISVVFPVYSSEDTTLDISIYIIVTNKHIYETTEHLSKGINNVFINYTDPISANGTLTEWGINLNSISGDKIFFYGMREPSQAIYCGSDKYYWATGMFIYHFISPTENITYQQFHFKGIQEPIIKYHYHYVYSLLDFPIAVYKLGMIILTNAIYFLTFGQVDLRYLYSNDFILKMAQGMKAVMDEISNWIGLFVHIIVDFLVNSAAWWGNWLLQFGLFILNVAAYAIFLWPWIVLARGLVAYQEQGVDAMLDYFSSYVDRVTSLMSKLMSKIPKGVG